MQATETPSLQVNNKIANLYNLIIINNFIVNKIIKYPIKIMVSIPFQTFLKFIRLYKKINNKILKVVIIVQLSITHSLYIC